MNVRYVWQRLQRLDRRLNGVFQCMKEHFVVVTVEFLLWPLALISLATLARLVSHEIRLSSNGFVSRRESLDLSAATADALYSRLEKSLVFLKTHYHIRPLISVFTLQPAFICHCWRAAYMRVCQRENYGERCCSHVFFE